MILSKVRDPRLVTIRRGGTLTDSDHQLLALWAALVRGSTFFTSSSRLGLRIHDRARRSIMRVAGCVARSG